MEKKRGATRAELILYRALKVIETDYRISRTLEEGDPKAYEQVKNAVEQAEKEIDFTL